MLTSGDKLVVKRGVAGFFEKGDIVKVIDVNENGMVSFVFGDGFSCKGFMSSSECEEYFEKMETKEKLPLVSPERIEEIMVNSQITVQTVFEKCTIVSCKLPCGFVIVESVDIVDSEDYDEEMGVNICLDKITSKIWELEEYRMQENLFRENIGLLNCSYDCYDCDDCPCDTHNKQEKDECLDTDLDCDDCKDYDCPFNNNKN